MSQNNPTNTQHIFIIFTRLFILCLFVIGFLYSQKDRFTFGDMENTMTYVHGFFFLLFSFIEIQILYIIFHIMQYIYKTDDFVKLRKLVLYMLEVLIDLCIIAPVIISLIKYWSIPVQRLHNIYFDNTQQLIQILDQTAANDFIIISIIPTAVLYVIQLAVLVGNMRLEMQVHHTLALVYATCLLTSEISTGLILFQFLQALFAALEFPLFAALIYYRMNVNGKIVTNTSSLVWAKLEMVFSFLRFYWAITRIVLVIMLTFVIVKHFESFTPFIQVLYPILTAVQIGTLLLTQNEIHGIHGNMIKNKNTSAAFEKNGNLPSSRSLIVNDDTRRAMMSIRGSFE